MEIDKRRERNNLVFPQNSRIRLRILKGRKHNKEGRYMNCRNRIAHKKLKLQNSKRGSDSKAQAEIMKEIARLRQNRATVTIKGISETSQSVI